MIKCECEETRSVTKEDAEKMNVFERTVLSII